MLSSCSEPTAFTYTYPDSQNTVSCENDQELHYVTCQTESLIKTDDGYYFSQPIVPEYDFLNKEVRFFTGKNFVRHYNTALNDDYNTVLVISPTVFDYYFPTGNYDNFSGIIESCEYDSENAKLIINTTDSVLDLPGNLSFAECRYQKNGLNISAFTVLCHCCQVKTWQQK
ncbi:MAG: hypothetical protein E7020_00230 [Alphaproteobacteria bacterium]|nr:hypothetical protein [Alphaproteobacteria bacterium]